MDTDDTRFWIGLGVAIIGIALQGLPVPHVIGYIGVFVGVAVMFWPALVSFAGPPFRLPAFLYAIPLRTAAQRSYERIEGTDLEDVICGLNKPVEDRLSWFQHSFLIQNLRIYGKRPPSSKLRLIPETIYRRLHPVPGKNVLTSDFAGEDAKYLDVAINRRDLKKYWKEHLTPLSKERF